MNQDLSQEFSEQELLITDIQLLGLRKKPWEFSRGARTYREYLYENGNVAIKDYYEYIMSDDNRQIVDIKRIIQWFTKNGEMFLEKDISPEYNIKNIQTLNRELRQGRMDYLESAGAELLKLYSHMPSPYDAHFEKAGNSVPVVLKYFQKEIEDYIMHGTVDFERLLNEEDNPIISDLLDTPVRPPDSDFSTGLTMRQSAIFQLNGTLGD